MGDMEITPAITELLVSFTVIVSLALMAMIFSVIFAQLMYSLFDD